MYVCGLSWFIRPVVPYSGQLRLELIPNGFSVHFYCVAETNTVNTLLMEILSESLDPVRVGFKISRLVLIFHI